ncbi:microsomal signal peptidase 12kDa subunit [Piptocephalis cylindrospora]|uniref:Signal peptidase complex subunit 1 n=1 Tax=Piptocephalis cylindrospora TaxID=1907219 RepID=A0A4V1IYP1_9FUNG|nr:microsomal signal peptidase 12kDa subunit [Piptocephalis cylindrospora]|eukprot:RKP15239.1 microsomal signal peptidase 12kDa subunit [Piptocephalis cylindrospora]
MSAIFEGSIDFEGQHLTQRIAEVVVVGGTAVSYVVGYTTTSVYNSFLTFGASVALAILICVPPWPTFNKHPVKFLPALKAGKSE